MVRKTLKEGMSVTKRTKKVKTKVAAKVQMQRGRHDVKPIESEVMVVVTYGPKNYKVKVFIGLVGGWIRLEIASYLEDEGDNKEEAKNDEQLVGVVHSGGHGKVIDSKSGFLSLSFYHCGDDGDYAQWLR